MHFPAKGSKARVKLHAKGQIRDYVVVNRRLEDSRSVHSRIRRRVDNFVSLYVV
jgi:hypothetical protein